MKKIQLFFSVLLFGLFQAQGNTILWKVSSPDSQNVSYLLGNFHQLGDTFVDSYPIIEDKIKQADLVILETLGDDVNEIIFSRKDNYEIQKYFSDKELDKIAKTSPDFKRLLYKYTPIELSWKLQQDYTKKTCGGITSADQFEMFDDYIFFLANKNKIPTKGLATMQEQLDNLNKQYRNITWKSEKKNILFYANNLLSKKPVKMKTCDDLNNFRNLNIDYYFDKPCHLDVLLTERNDKWLEELIPLLTQKNTFISVGYFHLGFKCGFIDRLKKLGFIVEPVQMKKESII